MRILIAGYQHETNTFAPSKADWAAFCRGDSFPAYNRGQAMQDQLTGVNIPIGGFIDEARARGWQLIPSVWAGAIPSAHVTREADLYRILDQLFHGVIFALFQEIGTFENGSFQFFSSGKVFKLSQKPVYVPLIDAFNGLQVNATHRLHLHSVGQCGMLLCMFLNKFGRLLD